MKVAILVDGGFYRRIAHRIIGDKNPSDRAAELFNYCHRHLHDHGIEYELYRIFYYDCPPSEKVVFHPYLQKQVNLAKSDLYKWSMDFFEKLKEKRKVALRLGKLAEEQAYYTLRHEVVRKICNGSKRLEDINEEDFIFKIDQKGVDMKIGLDIASMAYKKQVDKIVLISGDSDFVPAAKLARREGIDFVLDPLGTPIKPDLIEHIDGLSTKDNAYFGKTG